MELSQKQRQYLRKIAHDLKPVVQIGKNGVTDQTIGAVEDVITTQELIKVKFLDFQDEKNQLSEEIADRARAVLVAVIGNTAILYRQNPDPDERKVILPRA